jgi:N-acetylated-alpha-linked acidic dipeptidase
VTIASALLGLTALQAQAQPAISVSDLGYWPPEEREAYAEFESSLVERIRADQLRAYHDLLASEPHIASTPGDARVIETIVKTFEGFGLEVERHEFHAYMPMPVDAALEIVTPEPMVCALKEDELPSDPYSRLEGLTIGWNAYSGSGDVTAGVVYANRGTKEDFEKLADLGVSCEGKVVLARYGGNYRGYKAKYAEQAGAAALVIYTDPGDSGFRKGEVYPDGGYQTPTCIQRGSIKTVDYAGDPLTPFIEATKDAERLDPELVALPKIPVQPVGWQAAMSIMSRMTGADELPDGWTGGMPCDYRLTGGDELTVRVMVDQERKIRTSANVIGTLIGASEPERVVLIGAHHDAWGCGAADPTCGTICVLEAARVFSEMAEAGHRPARTIKFCAWGAEEFGIIGSAEWVEANIQDLVDNAVAYINLDMAAMGPNFRSAASPALRTLIEEVSRSVPQARQAEISVYEHWVQRSGGGPEGVPGRGPGFGDMGGGSDHVAFLCHAGVPSCSIGGGGSEGTAYHTNYDNLAWYRRVVGEDYEPALMVARMTTGVASRLASAPLVPLDPARSAIELPSHTQRIIDIGIEKGFLAADGDPRVERIRGIEAAARVRADATTSWLRAVRERLEAGTLTGGAFVYEDVNFVVMQLERLWVSPDGTPGRAWYRNLYAAPDETSGYSAWMLPTLRHAIEHESDAGLNHAVRQYYLHLLRPIDDLGAFEAALRAGMADAP